jgi:hypothetical protein
MRTAWKSSFKQIRGENKEIGFAVVDAYDYDDAQRRAHCNGYYERDLATVFGSWRLRDCTKTWAKLSSVETGGVSKTRPKVSLFICDPIRQ